ncbi:MAG: hypothetical protein QNM02_18340 [Acidimicrobiia bacterium]|nr:hypothetical protein [Acidimicrobiia bacterium]
MRVLIATNELQGLAPDDYAWTVEGELVSGVATECDDGDRCGCSRGFVGLASSHATTTAMVVERPAIGRDDLRDAVCESLRRGGWVRLLEEVYEADSEERSDDLSMAGREHPDDAIEEIIDEHVDTIVDVCDSFPLHTVISRQGSLVFSRMVPKAA